mmetsp:Transcript_26587/g.70193  ORF Transcript_26587/g.70193 Transcript_26587/m.70193 type:complete len:209 (+) Transcript_26587:440-1066(+)
MYRPSWKFRTVAACPLSSGALSIPVSDTLTCCVRFAGLRESVVSPSSSTSYRPFVWSQPAIFPVFPLCSCALERSRTMTVVPFGMACGGVGAGAREPRPPPLPGMPPMPPPIMPGKPSMPPKRPGMPPMPPPPLPPGMPPLKLTRGPPLPPKPPPPKPFWSSWSPKIIENGSSPPKNALKISSACWKDTPPPGPPPPPPWRPCLPNWS